MPITHEIKDTFLTVSANGEFSIEIVKKAFEQAVTDKKFIRPMYLLILDEGTDFKMNFDGLIQLASYMKSISHNFRPAWAIVVKSDLHFGMGRMFSVATARFGITFNVFKNEDAARKWILDKNSQ